MTENQNSFHEVEATHANLQQAMADVEALVERLRDTAVKRALSDSETHALLAAAVTLQDVYVRVSLTAADVGARLPAGNRG